LFFKSSRILLPNTSTNPDLLYIVSQLFGLVFRCHISRDLEFRSLENASPYVFIECISVISFVTCLEFITPKISYQNRVDDACFDLRRASDAVSDALLPRTLGTLALTDGTHIDSVFNQQIIACSKWDIFAVLSVAIQGYVKRRVLLNSFINATESYAVDFVWRSTRKM
jgi:hypothetical protein